MTDVDRFDWNAIAADLDDLGMATAAPAAHRPGLGGGGLWRLLGPDGRSYDSDRPGRLGGHRATRIYGRLDCRTARAALARGGRYRAQRVFFVDEATAIAAGYRPCAVCLSGPYARWKAGRGPIGGCEDSTRSRPG